jgi:regulator of protease activity HflC (stomatin/prohibitin superfamily)
MAMQGSDSPDGSARSPSGIAPLAVAAIAGLLLILFLPFLGVSLFFVSFVFILAVLALWRPLRRYRRLILLAIVPALVVVDMVGTYVDAAMNSGGAQAFMRAPLMRFVVGGPDGRLAWSIFLGLLAGLFFVWLLQETYILYNKDLAMGFTGADEATTRRALRALFLNVQRVYMIVDNGEVTTAKPAGVMQKLGGPGMVIIQPGNAVIFERGGKVSSIALNGVHYATRFERIRKIVQLNNRDNIVPPAHIEPGGKPGKKHWSAPNIWTKDKIALDIDLQVFFNVKRKPLSGPEIPPDQDLNFTISAARPTRREPYRVDIEDVYRVAFAANNWEAVVPLIAISHLRDLVGQRMLDDLFDPGPDNVPVLRGDICNIIRDRTAADVANWGVVVSKVVVGEVEIPSEVKEQLQERWLAQVHRDVALVANEADTEMLTELSKALEAYGQAGVNAKQLLERLRFIEAMAQMSKDPSSKLVIPYGFFAGPEGTGLLGSRWGGEGTASGGSGGVTQSSEERNQTSGADEETEISGPAK